MLYGLLRMLSPAMASAIAGGVLGFIGPKMGITRVAKKNLDLAFPEKTAEEKKKIIHGMWQNLGRILGEYPHLRRMTAQTEIAGKDHVDAVRASGKPAIFFSAHLANWEINGVCAQAQGLPLHLVYRKPNNPYVDGLLRHARAIGTAGYIEKGGAGARAIRTALKNDGVVAMMVDQKLTGGIAIPFFGHDAMTAPALAHFALKFRLPVYPARVERLGGTQFRVTVHPPIDTTNTGDEQADTRRILTEMNRLLEDWIRARPEQWLWIHKRWPDSV
jgi:Kdo2-lipid IVA lauroyltransferase/acyltransferase